MTKEEMKALVAKIKSQGNQVDLGGALASILDELVDGMGGTYTLELNSMGEDISEDIYNEALKHNAIHLFIEGEDYGEYPRVGYIVSSLSLFCMESSRADTDALDSVWCNGLEVDGNIDSMTCVAIYTQSDGKHYCKYYEM